MWSSASGAWRRTTSATSAMSVIVPTSLLTAMTLTIDTSGVDVSTSVELRQIDAAGVVDTDDDTAVVLDDVAARRGARRPSTPRRRRDG